MLEIVRLRTTLHNLQKKELVHTCVTSQCIDLIYCQNKITTSAYYNPVSGSVMISTIAYTELYKLAIFCTVFEQNLLKACL